MHKLMEDQKLHKLTHFSSVLQLCRNKFIDLHSKSMAWFLHNRNTGLKRVGGL